MASFLGYCILIYEFMYVCNALLTNSDKTFNKNKRKRNAKISCRLNNEYWPYVLEMSILDRKYIKNVSATACVYACVNVYVW